MTWNDRPLGTTGLRVTPLTVGGAPLGSMPKNFGYDVSEDQGVATARAALAGPIRALDTSSAYSAGESERRIGIALRELGGLSDGYLLSTKISRDLTTGDFSGAEMRRSIAGSLERLGLEQVPLVYLHDPENTTFEAATAPGGPLDVLRELKDSGVARAIGVAGGPTDLMARYLGTGHFDVLLTHNRWTLVNRNAGPLIDLAVDRGVGVVNAAVLGGGILATGTQGSDRYAYRPAAPEVLDAVRRIEDVATRAGVPLSTLATQFSTRDPRIATTVVGVSRPERIEQGVTAVTTPVEPGVFDEIDAIAASIPTDLLPA
ncbi:aldo/keto reductase [Promicromonospora sukumoe]|uniref:D-threo-aldose 1-dehydrogenase n=1 Tax=Promicromonospora sukumoe TaxID=88382 RepID=A0A7W3PDU9_9MICO|nr:aldo/keto reductase [Promicromonospora sukumoe]MBA8808350.1 D-threo-aldose 1-dehydrogenase [Promicromonospora sukumoe]